MSRQNTVDFVDPDPAALASLAVAAVGLIAPLVQTFRSQTPTISFTLNVNHEQQLSNLEQQVDLLNQQIKLLLRAIDRGSPDPEVQFYGAPMRLMETSLQLERGQNQAYHNALPSAFNAASAIGSWINTIVVTSPELAIRLGAKLDRPLQDVANELNRAMAEGRPIRTVVTELKAALTALASAIEDELGRN